MLDRADEETLRAAPQGAGQTAAPGARPDEEARASSIDGDGRLIAVFRAAGGAGATTLAVNLAWDIADADDGSNVALLDLDLQGGGATAHLDLARSEATESLLLGAAPVTLDMALTAMVRRGRLAVLPAPKALMPLDAVPLERIDALLCDLTAYFSFVVIDTPPALTAWSEPILRRADAALMLSRTLSLHEAHQTERTLKALSDEGLDTSKVELVLNGEPGRLDWTRQTKTKRFATLAGRAFRHALAEGGAAPGDAADAGAPLGELERGNPLRVSIGKLAQTQRAALAATRR